MNLKIGSTTKLVGACVLFVSVALFQPATASAQLSAYGAIAANDYGFLHNGYTGFKSDTEGIVAGVFYDFPTENRWKVGIDGRGIVGIGSRGGELAGVALRGSFVPRKVRLRPYLLLGGGVVSSRAEIGQFTGPATEGLTSQPMRFTNGAVEIAIGLDIRLTDRIDLRAFDWGGTGGVTRNSSNTITASGFLDGGVVYHLKPRSK